MKKVYIGFSSHIGFAPGSWLIRVMLNAPFSHTYFKFKNDELLEPTIFHAVGKGLTYISESNFLIHNKPIKEIEILIDDELFNELLNDCHENASKDYAYLQNIGLILVRGLSRIGINLKKNPFTYGINCSEWVAYILNQIDPVFANKFKDIDENLIGPDQIFDYLQGN